MSDQRLIRSGYEIPTESYSDQPYLVKTNDGAWLCVVCTGRGVEGAHGQHVISLRSTDKGRSWSEQVDLEPADGPEASYAVLLKIPSGRVFCFYNYNADKMTEVAADDPPFANGKCARVDTLGHFVFRYTDDGGVSWSKERYEIPQRLFDVDRKNPYGGKILFFWNVGKAFLSAGRAYVPIHKVGGFGRNFMRNTVGALLCSENLLTEADASKITWQTLPDGELGIRPPEGSGSISEEHSYVVDSAGDIHVVFRTTGGHPAEAVSRDGGHSFSVPEYRRFADGRLMKHPRAANFQWKCANGKYLYWFHNNSNSGETMWEGRNPVWLCGGLETDTQEGKVLRWSQPEILLYDDDPAVRMSYPDLLEDEGEYYVTETQKDVARVHRLDRTLLEGLWAQDTACAPAPGLLAELTPSGAPAALPPLPVFCAHDPSRLDSRTEQLRTGVTLSLDFDESLPAGTVLFDTLTPEGKGIQITAEENGVLAFFGSDGEQNIFWRTDPLADGQAHRVTFIADAGPHVLCVAADAILQDGGSRIRGFCRFSPYLLSLQGGAAAVSGRVLRVKLFSRALRVSEVIADWKYDKAIGRIG